MEAEQIAAWAVPFILTAAETYGDRVLIVAEDMAAGATIATGLHLLRQLFRHPHHQAQLRDAVRRAAGAPGDSEAQAQLRLLVERILAADPELAAEVRASMPR